MKPNDQNIAMQSVALGKEKLVAAAFLDAIHQLRTGLDDAVIENAININKIDAILDAVQIEKLSNILIGIGVGTKQLNFADIIKDTYISGARKSLEILPLNVQQLMNFDYLNYRAAEAMSRNGAFLIKQITDSTRNGLRTIITDAIQNNVPPKSQIKEIRQLIGLTDSQAKAVANYRRQLETRSNLGFTPAGDRRLSAVEAAMTRRHMKEGVFTPAKIDEMVNIYRTRLLNKRAMDIAKTETMSSVNAGSYELMMQGKDLGVLDDTYRKFWVVAQDDKLCPLCKAIPNMNPQGVKIDAYFSTPFGYALYPGYVHPRCRCSLRIEKIY